MTTQPCQVCGKTEFHFYMKSRDRFYHLEGEFELWRCGGCGLLRLEPAPEESVLAGYYPKDYYSYSDSEKKGAPRQSRWAYYLRHPLKAANALLYSRGIGQNLDESVKPGQAVLDVGCGDGRYLLKKKSEGAVCYGVEISAEAVRKLKQREPDFSVYCGNLWDAGFPAERFELVNLCHVLEHVQPTEKLLGEIRRLLKPGGRLRLQVPNASSLTSKLFGKYWMALDTPRHVYVFSRRNLEILFEKSGFEVLSVRTLENSFSVCGSLLYAYNGLTGKKHHLMRLPWLCDGDILKLLFFPYAFLVKWFGYGDTIELILRRPEKS